VNAKNDRLGKISFCEDNSYMLKNKSKWEFIYGSNWNANVRKYYNDLLRSQFASKSSIQEKKLLGVQSIVKHAYDSTMFYRERFDKAGLKPDTIQCFEDLKIIPPLIREDLNNHLQALISNRFTENKIHYDKTGGSTGLTTVFARSNDCLSQKKANEYRFNAMTGWKPGERILYYWPAIQDFTNLKNKHNMVVQKYYRRRLSIFAGKLNSDILKRHFDLMVDFKPKLIRAFPSVLQVFAEFVNENNLPVCIPKAIITVGESLNQFQRELFENTFNCEIYNCYVSRECGNMACECERHNGLHVAEELLHIEIDSNSDNDFGNILITDLTNYGMPLIRYKIQDMSRILNDRCCCGRETVRLDLEAARLSDYIISPVDRTKIGGPALIHYLLAEGPKVGRFQIIQDEIDHLKIRMCGNKKDNKKGIDHVKKTIGVLFDDKMNIDIEFVDKIPFLKSGKYQFVLRKV
jgi:phenylacetate-CoA ligase